jgi:hypothetical protein
MSHPAGVTPLPRSRLLAGTLAAAVAALAFQLVRSPPAVRLPLYDFVEYWAAARLAARGENPYDPARVGQLETAAGRDGEPLLMWNPPWTLPLVIPFGKLPAGLARLLWLVATFGTVLAAADAVWRDFGGPPETRAVGWLLAFFFVPTFLTLYLGQIAAAPLLGAVLYLRCLRRGRDFRAGACTALLAVKPHLFFLFWAALGLWVVGRRRWRVAAGAAFTLAAATLVAVWLDPAVLSQYHQALTETPPAQYRSPTLGTILRLAFGEERFGLQFFALLPGVIWLVPTWLRHRRSWEWDDRLPSLLFASLLTAPYGAWPFDLTVLLLPLLRVAAAAARGAWPSRAAVGLYVTANTAAAACVALRVDFFWWLWLTPALALAYGTAVGSQRQNFAPVACCASGHGDSVPPVRDTGIAGEACHAGAR